MTREFTDAAYVDLLATARHAGYALLTVREYLTREDLPERFLVLRHDVDRKPANALRFARLEARLGVESTYYVRTVDGVFDPDVVERIDALGHEVGYHYEDLDRADGVRARARALFRESLATLRRHATVDTACMHGNPLTPHDNREMWDDPADLAEFDLLGDAYLSMDFADVTYFSDAGRTWRDGVLKVKDPARCVRHKDVQADTTRELCSQLASGTVPRACVLSHPNRWASTYGEFVTEATKDRLVNAGKRGLGVLP